MRFLIILLTIFSTYAQDEWFFKDMLRGGIEMPPPPKMKSHFISEPKIYALDITGDGVNEYFHFQFIDGLTYLQVFDANKKLIIKHKFEAKGSGAFPMRILKRNISHDKIAVAIEYFEGQTGYLEKHGSSALYIGISEKDNLSKLSFKKISSTWLEHQERENYQRRPYEIEFEDINGDSVKDLIITSGKVKKIYYYTQNNNWVM